MPTYDATIEMYFWHDGRCLNKARFQAMVVRALIEIAQSIRSRLPVESWPLIATAAGYWQGSTTRAEYNAAGQECMELEQSMPEHHSKWRMVLATLGQYPYEEMSDFNFVVELFLDFLQEVHGTVDVPQDVYDQIDFWSRQAA
jgi:hypothetical protein